jgi:hypothetical protein
MIKIADYTEKLDRLNNFGRDDDAQREFDRICEQLFGATLDDITDEDYARFDRFEGDLSKKLNIPYCRSLGYDLIIRDRVRVLEWEDFAVMIIAKDEGLLPKTPEERAKRRLEAEAAEFLDGERPVRG